MLKLTPDGKVDRSGWPRDYPGLTELIDAHDALVADSARGGEVIHRCHWPTCNKPVPPSMWGCKSHWFKLPKSLRDRIWATYRPGQENTKDPSSAYIEAATAVQAWIHCEIEAGRQT